MIKAATSQSVHCVVWSQKLNAHEGVLVCPPLQAAVPHTLLIYPFCSHVYSGAVASVSFSVGISSTTGQQPP